MTPHAVPETRPNVVVLVMDALRADAVEPFGGPPGASPTITELAKGGIAVDSVRTTASWTLPAHAAMFTGHLARSLGLGQAPDQTPQGAAPLVRAQRARLLSEVLRRAGYRTLGVTTNVWCGKSSGFDAGFDEFVELDTSRHGALGGGLRQRLRWDWEAALGRGDDGAAAAERVIAERMPTLARQPFFLFVNLLETHSPYLPPRSYAPATLDRVLAADEAHRYLTFEGITRTCLGVQTVPERALQRMRRFYSACVRYADAWLARLLGLLDKCQVRDDTLVLVCSDHGENFGEGGLISHGLSLDDRLLRVPFIAAGPGAEHFDGMRSLAELAARVALGVGIDNHPFGEGLVAGLPIAQWDPLRPSRDALNAFAQRLGLGEDEIRRLTSPLTCAVAGHLKLVRGAEAKDEWLYDLKADPLELSPISGARALAARAGDSLQSLRAAVNHPLSQQTFETSVEADSVPADEAADIERKMRLLGYM